MASKNRIKVTGRVVYFWWLLGLFLATGFFHDGVIATWECWVLVAWGYIQGGNSAAYYAEKQGADRDV